jgi:hypothetical protein
MSYSFDDAGAGVLGDDEHMVAVVACGMFESVLKTDES